MFSLLDYSGTLSPVEVIDVTLLALSFCVGRSIVMSTEVGFFVPAKLMIAVVAHSLSVMF